MGKWFAVALIVLACSSPRPSPPREPWATDHAEIERQSASDAETGRRYPPGMLKAEFERETGKRVRPYPDGGISCDLP